MLKFPLIPPQQALSTFTVSKSELKRRSKQREAEARKAEKASKAAAAALSRLKKEKSGEELEGDLNPNQYFEIRSRQIDKLRGSKEPNPYAIFCIHFRLYFRETLESNTLQGTHTNSKPILYRASSWRNIRASRNIERCRNPSRCKNNDQAFI